MKRGGERRVGEKGVAMVATQSSKRRTRLFVAQLVLRSKSLIGEVRGLQRHRSNAPAGCSWRARLGRGKAAEKRPTVQAGCRLLGKFFEELTARRKADQAEGRRENTSTRRVGVELGEDCPPLFPSTSSPLPF